jgi:ankyrin repeat protein
MGNTMLLKKLLNERDINKKWFFNGNTLLCAASEFGQTEIVNYLLTIGANVNVPNSYGMAPIFVACRNNKTEIVKYLLSAGANCNIPTEKETVLDIVARFRNMELIQIFEGKDIKSSNVITQQLIKESKGSNSQRRCNICESFEKGTEIDYVVYNYVIKTIGGTMESRFKYTTYNMLKKKNIHVCWSCIEKDRNEIINSGQYKINRPSNDILINTFVFRTAIKEFYNSYPEYFYAISADINIKCNNTICNCSPRYPDYMGYNFMHNKDFPHFKKGIWVTTQIGWIELMEKCNKQS